MNDDELPRMAGEGHIDLFTFNREAGGVFLCGWVSHGIAGRIQSGDFLARFPGAFLRGPGMASFYVREGLGERGIGVVLFMETARMPEGPLLWLCLGEADDGDVVTPTPETRGVTPAEAAPILEPLLASATPALPALVLRAALLPTQSKAEGPPIDTTQPTLSTDDAVLWHIDETIACPPGGVALIGWCLAKPGAIRGVRLLCNGRLVPLDLAKAVRVPRPGVLEAIGHARGFDDIRNGFIAYAPSGYSVPGVTLLEIKTADAVVSGKIPAPRLEGPLAIRHLLDQCDVQYADVAAAFDNVLGPAVSRLTASYLKAACATAGDGGVQRIQFGPPPAAPYASIIIPVYGTLDFAEIQCALFSDDADFAGCEIIYVLDDPPARRDMENLAGSIHARFAISLTLLVLDRNLGFAPACNIGLHAARGRLICFLNSDVVPTEPGWLGALAARLDADPTLGIVGPRLLHEDGSLQHAGMSFRAQPQYGGWYFGHHDGLGLRPPEARGLRRHPAITGACMVMQADLALNLGGFDEAYVIGDFEDSDLCLRAEACGRASAVDNDVTMVHPGRRSQPSTQARWRMNLTLHNAWVHQQRWAQRIAAWLRTP